MSYVIRPSTIADLSAVDALLARSYPKLLKADYAPSVLVLALPVIAKAQPKLLACGTYYVAEQDNAVLGAGGWTRDAHDGTLGHIRHVASDDRHLRRGIGRAIISHCFDRAHLAGVQHMECWSTLSAESFYKSLGFETVGPMDVTLEGGITFPSLRMRKALA